MKTFYSFFFAAAALMLWTGCASAKLPSEDIEVLTECKDEIAVLRNPDIRANSKEKYEAAKALLDKVDFSYTRRVETLDAIFSSVDARVDNPQSIAQTLIFYYQYGNHSVRFLFHRYKNTVVKVEVIEN